MAKIRPRQTLEALLAWAKRDNLSIATIIVGSGWVVDQPPSETTAWIEVCTGRTLREALVKAQRKLGK